MCDNHYIMFEVCFMCYWEFQSGRVIITGQQYNFQDNVFCDNLSHIDNSQHSHPQQHARTTHHPACVQRVLFTGTLLFQPFQSNQFSFQKYVVMIHDHDVCMLGNKH